MRTDLPNVGAASTSRPLLQVSNVSVRFGGIVALDGVSFTMNRGHITGLIGPNGAGKSTLFNCVSRLYAFDGEIFFDGRPLTRTPAHQVVELGIGRTFQNLALFRNLTVRENVAIGTHSRTRSGWIANALCLPARRAEERAVAEQVEHLMARLDIAGVAEARVMDLPFGTQKRVELARALAARPSLLLLDEPAAGLNHEEVDRLIDLLRELRDSLDLSILLVEHHMNMVMRISDQVVALDFGRKIADAVPAQVQNNPDVIRAYLGDVAH